MMHLLDLRPAVRLGDTLDTALITAADTISSYIQGLLDAIEFKQTAYALDRDSRKAAPALPEEGFVR